MGYLVNLFFETVANPKIESGPPWVAMLPCLNLGPVIPNRVRKKRVLYPRGQCLSGSDRKKIPRGENRARIASLKKIPAVNREIVFALLLGFDLGITFMNIPPALQTLMGVYGVSYVTISVLIGTLFWSHALMQMPAGLITDRAGIKRTLVMSLFFVSFGNLLPAFLPSLGLAIVGRMIIGVGSGLGFVTTMKMVVLHGPEGKSGAYQAFFAGSFSFGSILAYMIIPLLARWGWYWIYILPGGSCLLLFPLLARLRLKETSSVRSRPLSLGQVLRIREGWVLGVFHALSYGSLIALGTWLPSILSEVWNRGDATQLAWSGALVMLVSGSGRLLGGILLSRFQPVFITRGAVYALFLIFLPLCFVSSPMIVLALAVSAAWFASINFGAIFQLASRATAPGSMGGLMGFINFLANIGAVLFTLLFGWMKDTSGSFGWSFAVLAFLCLIVTIGARYPERRPRS
jgi:MFS family permease